MPLPPEGSTRGLRIFLGQWAGEGGVSLIQGPGPAPAAKGQILESGPLCKPGLAWGTEAGATGAQVSPWKIKGFGVGKCPSQALRLPTGWKRRSL